MVAPFPAQQAAKYGDVPLFSNSGKTFATEVSRTAADWVEPAVAAAFCNACVNDKLLAVLAAHFAPAYNLSSTASR